MFWIFKVAGRFLFGPTQKMWRQPVGFICIFSIALAMASTIVTQSVIRGFETVYEKSILAFNAHLVITPWEPDRWDERIKPLLDQMKQSGIVESYSSFGMLEALALSPGHTSGVAIKGVDWKNLESTYHLRIHRFDLPSKKSAVSASSNTILSSKPSTSFDSSASLTPPSLSTFSILSQGVPVYVGKQLYQQMMDPQSPRPTLSLMLAGTTDQGYQRMEKVWIAGTFESGMYDFDSRFILTDNAHLEKMAGRQIKPMGYEVSLHQPLQALVVGSSLTEKMGSIYQVIAWQDLNAPLFEAMKMERTLFLIILSLVLLIASFGLSGMMLMVLWRRRTDLVILHAMGASRQKLVGVCALQGFLQAILGLVSGSVIAVFFLIGLDRFQWIVLDPKIYFIQKLPVAWDYLWFSYLWMGALTLCFASSYVAAHLALRRGVPVRGSYL